MIYDYLIVGQGIAGTILAHKLIAQGKSVHVVDNQHVNSSTKIAAGIINPITGRKFVKSWMIDQLLPIALDTYKEIEKALDIKIIHLANIIRVIFNEESDRHWERIQLNESAQKYIVQEPDISNYREIIHPIFGFGELTNSCRIDMAKLIEAYQQKFSKAGLISFEQFDYDRVSFDESQVNYNGLKAHRVIFCEGYKSIDNPLFSYLPFQPAKGQAIRFKLEGFKANKMLRHKQFIVPFDNNEFWSGGGYQWDDLNENTSEEFLAKWFEDMSEMIKPKPKLITHKAAVRPAVKGRRPLLGNHPKHKNAYIFNGMGTKGASLVPYWADHMVSYLENNEILDNQVDIKRFEP